MVKAGGNICRSIAQIGPAEHDAGIGGGGQQGERDTAAGMHAHAHTADRGLQRMLQGAMRQRLTLKEGGREQGGSGGQSSHCREPSRYGHASDYLAVILNLRRAALRCESMIISLYFKITI